MNIVKRQNIDVPVDKISGVEEMLGRMMNIDVENMPAKFKKAFDATRETAYKCFTMKCIYESYEIESIDDEMIKLKNGVAIESKLMAEIFSHSFELVFVVVTLNGYDEVDAAEDNMFLKLFLDSWGTAFVECGNTWITKYIAKDLERDGIYATHSFGPGQNEIPLEIQVPIFKLLNPQDIGVTLNDKYMMHPKKSISGIFGIQTQKDENRIRPCDLCERRETCPNAYS